MKTCIQQGSACIGRDCRELAANGNFSLCCLEEIREEKEIVQNIIDAIEDCAQGEESLLKISSKLSYGAQVINTNQDEELMEVLPLVSRFSMLLYEFKEKILSEHSIAELACTFTNEIKGWFSYKFLAELYPLQNPVPLQSICADMNTIEMALGVCMLEEYWDESDLDDLFF
jgi:hypothetical protein